MEIEVPHDVLFMDLDRIQGQSQSPGCLLAVNAVRDKLENLLFSRRQLEPRLPAPLVVHLLEKSIDDKLGYRGTQDEPSLIDLLDGPDDLFDRALLGDISTRSAL